jgi:hypothetical protein
MILRRRGLVNAERKFPDEKMTNPVIGLDISGKNEYNQKGARLARMFMEWQSRWYLYETA